MTGSLQIKNDKYYAVVRLPDINGKMHQKWLPLNLSASKDGKRKANQAFRRILTELEDKKVIYSPRTLFVDWLWKWLELKRSSIRENTYESYEIYLKLHIAPHFKPLGLTLDSLTPQHLQDYYNSKLNGTAEKKGLNPNSIIKHHVVILGALSEAVKKNLIPYNPAKRVTLPAKKRFEGKAYSNEQARHLVELLVDEPLKASVILGLFYGLRRSEACGMRWQDIDFTEGTMKVRNTVVKTKTVIEHEMTKSFKSKRTLYLIPETIPYLKQLRTRQAENKLLLGQEYLEGDHVCVWPNGKPVSPDYVSHAFKDFLIKNGLPLIRYHELRHTAGSLLLAQGLSIKSIQEYLGHEKAATTLDIYSHVSIDGKKESAVVMGGALGLKAI